MEKHFVTFCSPGTFLDETTTKEIESWDTAKAIEMSKTIFERYNSKPFGFYFTTRARGPEDLDSKEVAQSRMYYIDAKIETLEEVEARSNPKDKILISNMKSNGWNKIVTNADPTKNWLWTKPLFEGDVIL